MLRNININVEWWVYDTSPSINMPSNPHVIDKLSDSYDLFTTHLHKIARWREVFFRFHTGRKNTTWWLGQLSSCLRKFNFAEIEAKLISHTEDSIHVFSKTQPLSKQPLVQLVLGWVAPNPRGTQRFYFHTLGKKELLGLQKA